MLVVDDSKLTRLSLKTTLNQGGADLCWVGEAEDGREALQQVQALQPDVVLMDIGMPVLDGIAATQQLRQSHPELKIIMLTSHEEERAILDAFKSGATSYCLKETSPAMLGQVIRMTNNGACWIDPKIAGVFIRQVQPVTVAASTMQNPLTERELDVLRLLSEGKNNQEISEGLCISMNTVKTHLKNIFMKLEVEDRTAAALKALRERLV